MTKLVRVENADNSSYTVVVEVWQKSNCQGEPDCKMESTTLVNAAQMVEKYIHSGCYLVVKEGM